MRHVAWCRVQGFPTIKAFVNGRTIDYNGDRSAQHLKDWAISLIPQKVTVIPSADAMTAFLQRCGGPGGGKGKKQGKDGASWGGCVLLFSDKKQTSPLYKSLAAQFAGRLAFGEVSQSHALDNFLHATDACQSGGSPCMQACAFLHTV